MAVELTYDLHINSITIEEIKTIKETFNVNQERMFLNLVKQGKLQDNISDKFLIIVVSSFRSFN